MSNSVTTLLVLLGVTVGLGYLYGKASASSATYPAVKTATHVTFIVLIVLTLLALLRLARPWFGFGAGT